MNNPRLVGRGLATEGGRPEVDDQSTRTPDTDRASDPVEIARSLIDAGIPVVVCRPHKRHDGCADSCDRELDQPRGWATMTPEQARAALGKFRAGVDTLAMVAGHGVDVLDVDTKAGGSVDHLPAGVETFGEVRTPSGGVHRYVRSTGFGKISGWYTSAGFVGDYAGGTKEGGGRLLVYLPGSTRYKPEFLSLRDRAYQWVEPLDLVRLLEAEPDEALLGALEASGGSRNGKAGVKAVTPAAVKAFMDEHANQPSCGYGRKAVAGLLAESESLVPGDPARGRHGWFVAATARVVALMKAGCCGADDARALAARLRETKPKGGTDPVGVVAWAIANAETAEPCSEHGAEDPGADEGWSAEEVDERFPVLDWEALWDQEEDEDDWILYPLLRMRRQVALYSKAKAGKSLLCREIGASLSCGRYILGVTPLVCTVIYLDFENDPLGDIVDSLRNMGFTPGDLSNFKLLSFPTLAHLTTKQGAEQLRMVIARWRKVKPDQPVVVIIDTVSRTKGSGEENSNDTWLDWYEHTGMMLKREGVALLRLDHEGHTQGKQRGGSAKSGDVDAIWRLTKHTETNLELECDDSRYKLMPEEQRISMKRGGAPLSHTTDARSSAAWQRAVDEAVRVADEARLPLDAGYRKIEEATAAAEGVDKCSQRVAKAAAKARKERAS